MNKVSVIYTIFRDKEFVVKNNGHSMFLTLYGIDLEMFYKFPISSIISSLNSIFEDNQIIVNDVKYLENNFNRDQKQINVFKRRIEEYWTQQGYTLNPDIEPTYSSSAASKIKDLLKKYDDMRSLDNILSAHITEYNERIVDKKSQCEKELKDLETEYNDKIQELNDDLELKKHEADLYIESLRDKMRKEKATWVESHQDDVERFNTLMSQIKEAQLQLKKIQIEQKKEVEKVNDEIIKKTNYIKELDDEINQLELETRQKKNEFSKESALLDAITAKYNISDDFEKTFRWLMDATSQMEKELNETIKIYTKVHREYDKAKMVELDHEITEQMKKNEKFNF